MWSEEDRAIALAWELEQSEHCPTCRQERAVSFARETDGRWIAERHTCHSCAARERAAEADNEDADSRVYGAFYTTRLSP